MKPKYLYAAITFIAVIVVLVMLVANSIPASSAPRANPTSDARGALAEQDEAQVDAGVLIPTTTIVSTASEKTSLPDGPSLLESRCARCHIPQKLMQIERSRAEWELILAKMEALGVELSEPEKIVLLDYLSTIDEP